MAQLRPPRPDFGLGIQSTILIFLVNNPDFFRVLYLCSEAESTPRWWCRGAKSQKKRRALATRPRVTGTPSAPEPTASQGRSTSVRSLQVSDRRGNYLTRYQESDMETKTRMLLFYICAIQGYLACKKEQPPRTHFNSRNFRARTWSVVVLGGAHD